MQLEGNEIFVGSETVDMIDRVYTWIGEYDSIPQRYEVYNARFAPEFIYNTVAMEDGDATLPAAAEIFARGRVSCYSGKVSTLRALDGMRTAWVESQRYVSRRRPLNVPDIQRFHALIVTGDPAVQAQEVPGAPGCMRLPSSEPCPGCDPIKVPGLVNEMLMRAIEIEFDQDATPAELFMMSCYLHGNLMDWRPFGTADGKLARFVQNVYLMRCAMPPVVVPVSERYDYFRVLDYYHESGDLVGLFHFLAHCYEMTWRDEVSRARYSF